MKNITFAIPLIVGLALATPVLAQEATSTDQTTLAGQTEQSISPTDTVASEEGPTESASVESEPTAEASPAPENAQPVDHAELPSPAADQSQETAVADGSTATPANSEQSAREDTPAGDSDHVHTPEGIRIKYYVECDQLYQADVFGSSAPALCHDDLGKKYEMTITPEEYGRPETGGKLYKQILMTVEYAHQNAVKKITDAGRTEADIPKSLFDDPTVQNAQQPAENSQESSAATTTSEISASPEVTTDNAADTPAKDPNSASPPSETTTSVAATDVHAPAPTGDEPEPSPTPDDARSAPTATSPAKDTSAADTTSAITSSTTDLVQ